MNNKRTRKGINQVKEEVGALKVQSLLDCNQDGIISALRLKVYKMVDKVRQTQPNVSALMQKLITLRRDANTLSHSQSAY